MKNIKGISILEVLLALVVITTIITMSVRYYFITTRNMKATQAVTKIEKLTQLSYDWLETQRQLNFGAEAGKALSLDTLIQSGLISNTARDTLNPWGGSITLSAGHNPKYVRITLKQLPQKACRNLTQRLLSTSHAPPPSCNKTEGNVYTGEF